MNLSNKLTLSRIGMTFLLMGFLFAHWQGAKLAAFFIFLLACVTDFLDGWIARRRNEISDFGKIMDPIADKVLVLGLFLSFVELQLIPAWMVTVVIIREFFITGMRLFAVRRGVVLDAKNIGKHKTVSQMVTISFILVYLVMRDSTDLFYFLSEDFLMVFQGMILVLMGITVLLTLYSGLIYLWINRILIRSL